MCLIDVHYGNVLLNFSKRTKHFLEGNVGINRIVSSSIVSSCFGTNAFLSYLLRPLKPTPFRPNYLWFLFFKEIFYLSWGCVAAFFRRPFEGPLYDTLRTSEQSWYNKSVLLRNIFRTKKCLLFTILKRTRPRRKMYSNYLKWSVLRENFIYFCLSTIKGILLWINNFDLTHLIYSYKPRRYRWNWVILVLKLFGHFQHHILRILDW